MLFKNLLEFVTETPYDEASHHPPTRSAEEKREKIIWGSSF